MDHQLFVLLDILNLNLNFSDHIPELFLDNKSLNLNLNFSDHIPELHLDNKSLNHSPKHFSLRTLLFLFFKLFLTYPVFF